MNRTRKSRPRFAADVLIGGALLLPATPAARAADSLWSSQSVSLFSDNKARKTGDILTILIEEQTRASAQASTKADKSEDSTFGPGFGPILSKIKQFGLSGATNLSASGQTARSGALTGRITVTVKGVDPAGNLVLEGVREINLNAEKQRIVLRGLVRPADVQPDNTVLSALVADAAITFEGKGVIGDKQRPGLITRIFKFLF